VHDEPTVDVPCAYATEEPSSALVSRANVGGTGLEFGSRCKADGGRRPRSQFMPPLSRVDELRLCSTRCCHRACIL